MDVNINNSFQKQNEQKYAGRNCLKRMRFFLHKNTEMFTC